MSIWNSSPLLRNYLLAHEDRLQNRYIAKQNRTAWYRTIDRMNPALLDRDLLVLPDLARAPEPVLTHGCCPHHNFSWMSSDRWDLQALGGLLISATIRKAMEVQCVKMRGRDTARSGAVSAQAPYPPVRKCEPGRFAGTGTGLCPAGQDDGLQVHGQGVPGSPAVLSRQRLICMDSERRERPHADSVFGNPCHFSCPCSPKFSLLYFLSSEFC